MSQDNSNVMDKVCRALGRTVPLTSAPTPPAIDESITRLLAAGANLGEVFLKMCEENKMHAQIAAPADLPAQLGEFLRSQNVRRIALSAGGVCDRLSLAACLRQAGFEVKSWNEMTLDELYDFDCGVTPVDYAVAETGSLVVCASPSHGRGLSLIPPIHVAIVEQSNLLPDLMDLFQALSRGGAGSAASLITGPSKTSDIEMNLVIGVHGPLKVQVFLVS